MKKKSTRKNVEREKKVYLKKKILKEKKMSARKNVEREKKAC